MKRQLIAFAAALGLASAIVLGSAGAAQAASVTTTLDGFTFTADDSNVAAGATVTGYTGTVADVVVPPTVSISGVAYAVTTIGTFGISSNAAITSVTLPDSVTTIQPGGIEFDHNLTSISLGNSLTSIGIEGLYQDNITSIVFPASMTSLAPYVLYDNFSLTSVLFEGNAPSSFTPYPFVGADFGLNPAVTVSYDVSATGFTSPTWGGYASTVVARVSYDLEGHGSPIADTYAPVGSAHAAPASPVAKGFTFGGWFSNASLTTAADFGAAISTDTTLFAKWTADPVLPTTGVSIPAYVIPTAIGVVLLGVLLIVITAVRRRRRRGADS